MSSIVAPEAVLLSSIPRVRTGTGKKTSAALCRAEVQLPPLIRLQDVVGGDIEQWGMEYVLLLDGPWKTLTCVHYCPERAARRRWRVTSSWATPQNKVTHHAQLGGIIAYLKGIWNRSNDRRR